MPLPKDNLLFGFAPKLTGEQMEYVDSIFDNQVTFVNAKSGTGKTTLAVACAKIMGKPLIYVFSPVEENKMGFRPGEQHEKEAIYYQPLVDALTKIGENPDKAIYDPKDIMNQKSGNVWVYPKSHVFVRGTNLENVTIVIDEAQNFTVSELRKILTRIHDNCKVIVIGHDGQCDLKNPQLSGFTRYIEHFREESYVGVVKLSKNFRGRLANKADELLD